MNIEVSIVIPTYKRRSLLERCIKALQDQKFSEPYEVIVVTDGYDSETQRMIEDIHDTEKRRFRVFSLPTKRGPAAARNAGWRSAKGALIVFTDDDCIPDDFFLRGY